jgi:tryptophanyl-tRNA synthetase
MVTVARLERNPTVKTEIALRGFERDIPAGFLTYPAKRPTSRPSRPRGAGGRRPDPDDRADQRNRAPLQPHRQPRILVECKALVPDIGRLPGIDGKAKMSKSLGNTINLGASGPKSRPP